LLQKVGGYLAHINPPGEIGQFFDRPLSAHPLMPNSFCLLVIAHKSEGFSFGRSWFVTVQAGVIIAGRAVFDEKWKCGRAGSDLGALKGVCLLQGFFQIKIYGSVFDPKKRPIRVFWGLKFGFFVMGSAS
jgi:hypothetical protein